MALQENAIQDVSKMDKNKEERMVGYVERMDINRLAQFVGMNTAKREKN